MLASLGWLAYDKAYTHGYKAAEAYYLREAKANQDRMLEKVSGIETNLDALASNLNRSQLSLSRDMAKILANNKNSPQFMIKNGRCVPTPEFLTSIDTAIQRANSQ